MRIPCLALLLSLLAAVAAPVRAAPPGTLESFEPMPGAPAGARAWRIRYWTTSDRGRPIAVTGFVVAPRGGGRPDGQGRPVLAWTHGTWGVVERCAPSLGRNVMAVTAGLAALERGYVVVAPDYPGLGSAGAHAYLGGVEAGRATLDAVRAVRSLPAARAGTRFAVWGESQGGHAALWTGQLAGSYAPDLGLFGVAAAAPPTDLVRNLAAGGDPSVRAFLTAFVAYSWSQHYGAPLASLGGRQTQGVISRLARNNCIELGKKPRLGTALGVLVLRRDLKSVDLGRIQPWARLAAENSPSSRPAPVPYLIAQNPRDVIVAPDVTRDFARRLCRGGARLRYLTVTGKGHETTAADSAAPTLDWIDARFAGRPARSDCGRI